MACSMPEPVPVAIDTLTGGAAEELYEVERKIQSERVQMRGVSFFIESLEESLNGSRIFFIHGFVG